jgi:hypothetical protein
LVSDRRLPPPGSVEEQSDLRRRARGNGEQLSYVHFEDESSRRSATKLLSLSATANAIFPNSISAVRSSSTRSSISLLVSSRRAPLVLACAAAFRQSSIFRAISLLIHVCSATNCASSCHRSCAGAAASSVWSWEYSCLMDCTETCNPDRQNDGYRQVQAAAPSNLVRR